MGDNTPGIGCGPLRCMSNLEGRSPDDCKSMAAKNELDTYQKTLWCWSAYCCFQGFTYDLFPICQQEGKLCCLWIACESASCCDDGWIEFSGKTCCCVLDASIPAGKTPGIVCCGVTLFVPRLGRLQGRVAKGGGRWELLARGFAAWP